MTVLQERGSSSANLWARLAEGIERKTLPTEAELRELEDTVVEALRLRDDSALNILGYGEVSVALGWPTESPTFVCKRTPPFTKPQFTAYRNLVGEYIAGVEARGLAAGTTRSASASTSSPTFIERHPRVGRRHGHCAQPAAGRRFGHRHRSPEILRGRRKALAVHEETPDDRAVLADIGEATPLRLVHLLKFRVRGRL